MNFKIKLSKNIIILLFLLLLFLFLFLIYFNNYYKFTEGLTNNNLSRIEALKRLQKESIASKVGKEKQLNIDFNNLMNLKEQQDEITDLQNNQLNLDNQLKELNQQRNEIIQNHGGRLAKNFFGTPADAVSGAKPVSNSIKNHLNSMNQSEPFSKTDGLPGSQNLPGSTNNNKNKCLASDKCQTKPFYKGNFIPTGNALYGSCPCPETDPDVVGAHWSCCPVPTN